MYTHSEILHWEESAMNLITISNDRLTVILDGCGAVLHSIRKDGAEYL